MKKRWIVVLMFLVLFGVINVSVIKSEAKPILELTKTFDYKDKYGNPRELWFDEAGNVYWQNEDKKDEVTLLATVAPAEGVTEFVVPDTLLHNGKEYLVTAVGDGAYVSEIWAWEHENWDKGYDYDIVVSADAGYKKFVYGKNVKYINQYAHYCSGIEEIVLQRNVIIGESAVFHCRNLKKVTGAQYIRKIKKLGFSESGMEEIGITDNCTFIGKNAFYYSSLKKLPDLSGVKKILQGTFAYTELKEAVIAEGVKRIGANAFRSCKKLKTAVIPDGVKEIGKEAFAECKKLKNVSFPKTLKKVGIQVFRGTYKLKGGITIDKKNPYFCIRNSLLLSKNKRTLYRMLTYTGKTLVIPKYIKEVKIGWYFSRGVLGTGKQIKKVVVKNPKTKIPKKGYGFEDLNIKIIRRS